MLKTDYIDFGFIHCIDETRDWQKYVAGGIFDYLQQMKSSGVVHHIGLSSHTPALANKVLDTGMVDMLMFSINPGYDYRQEGEFAIGSAGERMSLYRRCATEGIGIIRDEAFWRWSATGRTHIAIQTGFDRSTVHPVRP